jgi:small subunit ribosomal protein S17
MKVTPRNLVRHELVGMNAHIVESKDPSLLCRRGTIVDESKETIRLDTGDREIMTPKSVCVFGLRLPGGELVHIDGRDIGVPGVEPPKKTCTDPNCPFHGSLPVRGRLMQGIVTSTKMHNAVTYRQDYLSLVAKYSRYERRRSNKHAHLPPCIEVNEGDIVRVAECRPISKTVKGVVISVKRPAANQEE